MLVRKSIDGFSHCQAFRRPTKSSSVHCIFDGRLERGRTPWRNQNERVVRWKSKIAAVHWIC